MASRSFCGLVFSLLFLVVALGLTVTAIVTDYWYDVSTEGTVTDDVSRLNNYHFGFWRKCYDNAPLDRNGDDCERIYDELVEDWPDNISHYEEVVIHLSRSYILLSIISGAGQLAAILILLCGSWPGKTCGSYRKPPIYISAVIVVLLALMCGIASGICFIAARDVEENELNMYSSLSHDYEWSFMLAWAGTGACLIDAIVLMCMVKYAYNDASDQPQTYYYTS